MDDEWDLHALVRSCTTASGVNAITVEDYNVDVAASTSYNNLESLASGNDQLSNSFVYPAFGNVSGGLEDVYASAGCGKPPSTASAAVDLDGGEFVHEKLPMLTDSHSLISMNSQSTRPKKRKNQEKTVFQLTEEELGNDLWAWRKYGQKPIKGSPFPRNYYRCSTTKACDAKKQVERSCIDSTLFIVSYSGQHIHPRPTHRSSLAGSTRSNKFNTTAVEHRPPPCSSSSPAASASSFSPTTSFNENECEITDKDDAI